MQISRLLGKGASGYRPVHLGLKWLVVHFCSSNFSVAHSGLYDVKRHSEISLHKKGILSSTKTSTIDNFLPVRTTIDHHVIRTETLFCNFEAELNLVFSEAEHFSDLRKTRGP